MTTHEQHIRALAPHFINEIVEEARLISTIASESGLSWRDLLMTNYDMAAQSQATMNCKEDSVVFNIENVDMTVLTSTPKKEDQREFSFQNTNINSIPLNNNVPVEDETITVKNELDLIQKPVDKTGEDVSIITKQINPDLIAAFRYEFDRISEINEREAYLNKTYDIMTSQIFEPECSEAKYKNFSDPIVLDDIDKTKHNEPNLRESDAEGNVTKKDEKVTEVFDYQESHRIAAVNQEDNTDIKGNKLLFSELSQETMKEIETHQSAFGLLEKTFFTLNRNDEPSSDVESSETSEKLTMHEVELLMHVEEQNSEQHSHHEEEDLSQLVPKNDTRARRIRSHGSRLFSWIRELLRRSVLIGRPRKQRKRAETQSSSGGYMPEERLTQWKYEFKTETDSSEGIWKSKDDLSRQKCLETDV